MYKKLKIAITTAVVSLTAAVSAFGGAFAANGASAASAEESKYLIDSGVYSLKMDDSVTETVSYRHTQSYLLNARDVEGDIRLKFRTVSAYTELEGEEFYGLVRGKSDDAGFAYADLGKTFWYVFGAGNPGVGDVTIYKEGANTDIYYDTSAHAFSVSIDGENQSSKMAKFVASANGATADSLGATKICWDATNTDKTIEVTLEDFAITDAEGYDLGVELSGNADKFSDKRLETSFYGYAGKTVTFKRFDEGEVAKPAVLDKNGNVLNVEISKTGSGEYSFVMPAEEIKIQEYNEVNDDRYYGTYYNAESGNGYIFGETTYKFGGAAKTEVSVTAYDIGLVVITDGETTVGGNFVYGNLFINGAAYKRLLRYTVKFVADGKEIKIVTVDSGDYVLEDPELTSEKEGYSFVGWKTGKGENYEFGKVISESVTLYADFKSDAEHKDPSGGCGGSFSAGEAGIALLAAGAAIIVIRAALKKGKKEV